MLLDQLDAHRGEDLAQRCDGVVLLTSLHAHAAAQRDRKLPRDPTKGPWEGINQFLFKLPPSAGPAQMRARAKTLCDAQRTYLSERRAGAGGGRGQRGRAQPATSPSPSRQCMLFARPDLVHFPPTHGVWATGDGMKMAMAIGADTVDMDRVQIHPTGFVDPKDLDASSKVLCGEMMRGVGGVLLAEQRVGVDVVRVVVKVDELLLPHLEEGHEVVVAVPARRAPLHAARCPNLVSRRGTRHQYQPRQAACLSQGGQIAK